MLPPETEKVWAFIHSQPALAGFILIGGAALALRIQHRLSEDLDLVWPEARLPRVQLDALCRNAIEAGFVFEPISDEVTVQQFLESGLDLQNYQQNFLVNQRVKVSFFAPQPPLIKVLRESAEPVARVATVPELFRTKCLVSAQRSKTRDWVDLYLLLRHHGFTLHDYREAFQEAGVPSQSDIGLTRLCSGIPQKDDEGYAHLLPTPPTLDEMKAFFIAQRDQLEVDLAAEAFRNKSRQT